MMPSKKKKYNARFPAGRIKKIMQTDEEVGKVAQAVPVIISRTLELFVQSLLVQATRVTTQRNAKTLSPSHLKQCILHEARFDFLRDLVKNIPDVSAAEEKELQSAENSPNSNSTGYTEPPSSLRRPQEPTFAVPAPDSLKRRNSDLPSPLPNKLVRTETVTSTAAIDLSIKSDTTVKRNIPNFYQETLTDEEEVPHSSVIRVNPSYANPQPSTSQLTTLTPVRPTQAETVPKIETQYPLRIDLTKTSTSRQAPLTPRTPVTPVINIDFTKNISKPEIHVLNSNSVPAFTAASNARRIDSKPVKSARIPQNYTVKALSRSASQEHRKMREPQSPIIVKPPDDIDRINSGNLEIDEDYDT